MSTLNLRKAFNSFQSPEKLKNTYADVYAPKMRKKHPKPKLKGEGTLRLVTFNVHFHEDYRGKKTKEKYEQGVRSAIEKLKPDVLVLEEVVTPEALFSKEDFPHVIFHKPTPAAGLGNAIVSRYPLQDEKCVTFKPSPNLRGSEARCYIAATIEPREGCKIRIMGTHLDVWDESGATRVEQVKELEEESRHSELDNIVCCGDFNAIQRSDYDSKHWEWLIAQDEKRGVKTVTNALDLMVHEYKWRDAFLETAAFQGKKKPKGYAPPNVTTWTLRRVDFMMLSQRFKLPIKNAFVLYEPASDHFPLGIDIDISN